MSSENIKIEGARLIWRNFAGRKEEYNPEGRRNFCVIINPDSVNELRSLGWPIKERAGRDEEEDSFFYLQVKVKYDRFPPRIYMVTSKKKTLMNEASIGELDYAIIRNVDLVIRPYEYETGKISAYVQTMYVTIEEDEFADKYDFAEKE